MKSLLKHFNIDKNKFRKILAIFILIKIIEITIIALISKNFLFVLVVELLLNYGLAYYIFHLFLFGGSSSLITRYNCWRFGLEISKLFGAQLEDFKKLISDFSNKKKIEISSENELYSKSSTLSKINELIYSYLKLSNTVDEKDMSKYQKDMVFYLNKLKISIESSQLSRLISEATVRFQKEKKFEINSENLDKNINKITDEIDCILKMINQFQLKGNLFSNILNFLRNDSFGSLKQLKSDLLSKFYCDSFKVNLDNNKTHIDCLLIKNKDNTKEKSQENKEKEEETKIDDINTNINEKENDSKTEEKNEKEKEKIKKREENNKNTVILICNKSLYPYELCAYYDKWVECYLSLGINVALWNYRGYGESNGFSSISNIQTDSEAVIDHLRTKYHFTNIGVHGINLGGIPASYLYSKNKINFCFVDRCFGSLYKYVQSLTSININFLLKALCIDDCNLVKLLNSNLAKKRNSKSIYKVISYDLKKDLINDNESLKTMIAKDFYKKLTNNKNKYILKDILNGTKEYEMFESDIFYVIQKLLDFQNETKDYRLEFNSIMESISYNFKDMDDLDSQIKNNIPETTSPFEKDLHNEENKVRESKVITSIKHLFEKFDAGGETLLTLYKTNNNRKKILNNFFVNLLSWGSYKVGKNYASDLVVAYKAVVKKFPYVNGRIQKILDNPEKYTISDGVLSSSLKTVLDSLLKIEKFFDDNFLNQNDKDIILNINDDSMISQDRNNNNLDTESSVNALNKCFKNDIDTNKILNFLQKINLGNLLILNCGDEGEYSTEELKMFSTFLLNSNFIK